IQRGYIRQRASTGKEAIRRCGCGNIARKCNARNFPLAAAATDFTDSLTHERGGVDTSFTSNDQVCGAKAPVKICEFRKQTKSWFGTRSEKYHESETQSSGGARAGNCGEVLRAPGRFTPKSVQCICESAQAFLRDSEVLRPHAFLRAVDLR